MLTHRFWRAALARIRFVRNVFWEGCRVEIKAVSISCTIAKDSRQALLTIAYGVDDVEGGGKIRFVYVPTV